MIIYNLIVIIIILKRKDLLGTLIELCLDL